MPLQTSNDKIYKNMHNRILILYIMNQVRILLGYFHVDSTKICKFHKIRVTIMAHFKPV